MNMSPQKRVVSGMRAALVALGVLGCFLLATLMISGRGSTYQSNAQQKLAQAYRDDFCGNTGTESSEKGEAGNTMVAYNYPAAEAASSTGSGAGLKAASCRTDAFAGSDNPYTETQLKELNETPGQGGWSRWVRAHL
jgi:ABC-type phosphate transport system substrate-binding protein